MRYSPCGERPCGPPASRWIMTLMRLRTALYLALTILIVMPVGVLAEPPPQTTPTDATGPVTAPPDTSGQVVTIVVPAQKPLKKPRKKATASKPPTPAPSVTRRRVVTPSVSRRAPATPARRSQPPGVRGGASKRVVVPSPPRGGASTILVERPPPAVPQDTRAVVTPAVATPTVVEAKPRNSTNWALWLLVAVGVLETLVLVRFACRRWSNRRSLRRAARNLAKASAVRAPDKTTYYGRRQAAKRSKH